MLRAFFSSTFDYSLYVRDDRLKALENIDREGLLLLYFFPRKQTHSQVKLTSAFSLSFLPHFEYFLENDFQNGSHNGVFKCA